MTIPSGFRRSPTSALEPLASAQPDRRLDSKIEASIDELFVSTRNMADGDEADLISRYGDFIDGLARLHNTGAQLKWLDHLVHRTALFADPSGSEKPEARKLMTIVLRDQLKVAAGTLGTAAPDVHGHDRRRRELAATIDGLIELAQGPSPLSTRRTDRTFNSPLDAVPDAVAGKVKSYLGAQDRAMMNGVSNAARARFGQDNAIIGEYRDALAAEKAARQALLRAEPARHWYSPPARSETAGPLSKLKQSAMTGILGPVLKGARKRDSDAFATDLAKLNSAHTAAASKVQESELELRILVKAMLRESYNPAAAKLLDALEPFTTREGLAALEAQPGAATNAVKRLWGCVTAEAMNHPAAGGHEDPQKQLGLLQTKFDTEGINGLLQPCNNLRNRIVNGYMRLIVGR